MPVWHFASWGYRWTSRCYVRKRIIWKKSIWKRSISNIVFAMLERGVILDMSISKSKIFITTRGVICKVFIISAPSEASLYGVFDWSVQITHTDVLIFVSFFLLSLLLCDRLPVRTVTFCYLCCRNLKFFGPKYLGLIACRSSRYLIIWKMSFA